MFKVYLCGSLHLHEALYLLYPFRFRMALFTFNTIWGPFTNISPPPRSGGLGLIGVGLRRLSCSQRNIWRGTILCLEQTSQHFRFVFVLTDLTGERDRFDWDVWLSGSNGLWTKWLYSFYSEEKIEPRSHSDMRHVRHGLSQSTETRGQCRADHTHCCKYNSFSMIVYDALIVKLCHSV